MAFVSLNPATGRRLARHPSHPARETEIRLSRAHAVFQANRLARPAARTPALRGLARTLRAERDALAQLITAEVGKPIAQALAEVDKSAAACDYAVRYGVRALARIHPPGAPQNAEVVFAPLGVVLAIMPWNFPLWQAIRAAVPALLAGNTMLLKPAPTTAGITLALERAFTTAGFEPGAFQTALVEPPAIARLIADPRIAGVTLTGSTRAGKSVGQLAGAAMKPAVFELGGSDAYLILEDADLDLAADRCVQARLVNSGQSCVAAKRFIVVDRVRRVFEQRFVDRMAAARVGDPTQATTDVGPLARADLRDQLVRQMRLSVRRGARVLLDGGPLPGAGYFHTPVVLTDVRPGMPAFDEELFGPVAAIVPVRDEAAAISTANRSRYGLGAAVFGRHRRARNVAAQIEAGFVAINDFVRSDPALPFGGVKESGLGRELGEWGTRSFVNVKTVVG